MSAPSSIASRDSNRVTTLIGVSDVDFSTPVTIAVNPTTGAVDINGTVTATNPSVGTTGSAVPGSATYLGINVSGNLRGQTGVNPSGSIYAAQVDLASVGGSSVSLGQKTMSSSIPVAIASDQGTVPTSQLNTVDSANSSTSTLLANATFTGTGFDALNYTSVEVLVYSDQSSAANGVQVQFSSNNSNWDDASTYTFTAGNAAPNAGQVYIAAVRARYCRVVYTNGGTNQTAFRLSTIFKAAHPTAETIPMSDVPTALGSHGLLTKSAIVGKTTAGGGSFVDVKVNPSGALTAAVTAADGDVFVRSNAASTFPVNIGQINGVAPTMGNGVSGTGVQRVTIASDSTGQVALAAGTNNIGVVDIADTSGNKFTSNSTTYTSKFALDGNLLGTLGTAFSTAGKVDVKGADGDVFVRQSTFSNLKAQVDLSASSANTTAGLISVKIDQTTVGSTNAVTPVPASNSGWSFSYQSALSNTATQIKGTAGTFGGYLWLYNPNTTVTFIQVFNKASASVTLGSTTPDYVIALPGIASASATGSAANMEMVHGIAMSTGITVAATTTATGSTAPSSAVVATFLYK